MEGCGQEIIEKEQQTFTALDSSQSHKLTRLLCLKISLRAICQMPDAQQGVRIRLIASTDNDEFLPIVDQKPLEGASEKSPATHLLNFATF